MSLPPLHKKKSRTYRIERKHQLVFDYQPNPSNHDQDNNWEISRRISSKKYLCHEAPEKKKKRKKILSKNNLMVF